MTTLNDVRRLLEGALKHDDNPAILRLPESERTVEGVAGAYLPQSLRGRDGARSLHYYTGHMLLRWSGAERVDLTDPGTAHALLVALALFLGLDPGEGGLNVAWHRSLSYATNIGWHLIANLEYAFVPTAYLLPTRRDVQAPEVAAETDARKALALAVRRVLS